MQRNYAAGVVGVVLALAAVDLAAQEKPGLPSVGPKSPRDEQATFRLPAGFRTELVASEPDVVDPVAMAFDEDGRIYVAEMVGYPNAGVATGDVHSGRIKRLEDRDDDGVYETATLFADGLRFPTSVMPWKGGLLVANAPDLIYLEDADGDGKADRRRTLYTGFALANIQQLLNGLQWGMDNWVYGVAGNSGGTITCVEKAGLPPVVLRGRGVRFHPEVPGSLEPTSGGGQYGLAPDAWQRWFTATNSQHLRNIILPEQALRRNPSLPVSTVVLDIPDHGAACKVHRLSPFEGWRVERTRRRREGADARRFSSTELVPGGFITSACSPVVYLADLFPESVRGQVFVCDPANNLIHRDRLVPKGATFTAVRADDDCEFLASTDNWFRPVYLTLGPDGALYLLDFYREVIETPLSLPEDIKQQLNLNSRGRGRIWRITHEGAPAFRRPALGKAPTKDLVAALAGPNLWYRLTAQRLLMERNDRAAVPMLAALAAKSDSAEGRAHALWALDGLQALDEAAVLRALADPVAGVREQGLRLAESRLAESAQLRAAAVRLADDDDPKVRFQLALSLGAARSAEVVPALASVLRRDLADPWTQTAVLSAVADTAPELLEALARDASLLRQPGGAALLARVAGLAVAKADDAALSRTLAVLSGKLPTPVRLAVLEGMGQGLQNTKRPLNALWDDPPAGLRAALDRTRTLFAEAAAVAPKATEPAGRRAEAVRLLAFGPYREAVAALQPLLTPQTPSDLQLAAVRSLAQHNRPQVAGLLVEAWPTASPTLRGEMTEALFARPDRLRVLLTALEKGDVGAGQIDPTRAARLRNHPDRAIRQRALKLLTAPPAGERAKLVTEYQDVLKLSADAARGKAVFKKNCATCHRLENEGHVVGAELIAALPNKTPEALLIDVLDPGREVDPRYLNYLVTLKNGRSITGIIASESATSLTLRRAENAEDVVLRNQIESISAATGSLMPEGLEKQMSKQELADLIAYLQAVVGKKAEK